MKNDKCRNKLYEITSTKEFDQFITACIVLNTFSMTLTWHNEPSFLQGWMVNLNYIFTGIYTIEAAALIIVDWKSYFKDEWRQFDFLIVLAAIFGIILKRFTHSSLGALTIIIRVFRIARVFKMVKRFRKLRKILNTFIVALPTLGQIGSLIIIQLMIYSILGVHLFSRVMHMPNSPDGLNEHANFSKFPIAFITLIRILTGEAWNEIMMDLSHGRSLLYQCEEAEQTIDDFEKRGPMGCGLPHTSRIYFISFTVIGVFVMLNMFISIIMDGYNVSQEQENMRINEETVEIYKKLWHKYDKKASGLIDVNDLNDLLLDLILDEVK